MISNHGKKITSLSKRFAPVASSISSLLVIVCPLCIPAFGAFLASIGLGFALNFEFLRGLVIALLLISGASLAWSARWHKRWAIFFLGLIGGLLIYSGRYLSYSLPLMLAGAFMLIGASFLNLRAKSVCKECDGHGEKKP